MFRVGDMDVASLLSTTGMLCLSNKGFLLLFILKSKVLPIQRAFEDHYHLQAMTVVALAMLCKLYP